MELNTLALGKQVILFHNQLQLWNVLSVYPNATNADITLHITNKVSS